MNVIHHYRRVQITAGTQCHASVAFGFDATCTTLTDHPKITTYITYWNNRFLLPLILFWRHEQKVQSFSWVQLQTLQKLGLFPLQGKTFLKPIRILWHLLSTQGPNVEQFAELKQSDTNKQQKGQNRPDIFTGLSSHWQISQNTLHFLLSKCYKFLYCLLPRC